MIGGHSGFKLMAVSIGAMAMVGAMAAGDANHFARLAKGKNRKDVITSPTPTPTPTPPPTTLTSNTAYPEESAIASNFDVNSELVASWGTGQIPASAVPDVVGAFRFICNPGQLLADDPIVFPGQPGRSHLHQFFGNTEANANSTYASLRTSGKSTCNSPLNRSAYWMPAMLDGAGNVVRPDYVSIYYKRRPQNDPKCSLRSGDPRAEGDCIPLPNGLRFVFGFDMLNANSAPTGAAYFNCDGLTGRQGHYLTLAEAAANCPVAPNPDGSFNRIGAVIGAPSCWDGKNLDSPDHRSHVAYAGYGDWGYFKCPTTHPKVIPTFTMGVWYTVDRNTNKWRLSSDSMVPGAAPGSTLHADWFGAWDNTAEAMWTDNCINKLLNCSGGDLGNGKQLRMFDGFSWSASPRLVPVA
jgi:hypothetical protein